MYRCLILWVLPPLLLVIVYLLNQAIAEEADTHSNWDVNRMIMSYDIVIATTHSQSLVLLLSYLGRV